MVSWLWMMWLGCGSLAGAGSDRLSALEARAAEIETELEARRAAPDVAPTDVDGLRERRMERLQRLRDARDAPPPSTLREAMEDPEAVARSARALLHRGADGAYAGFRLSAIRPGGLADRLGFREGDVLQRIDDRPLTSMEAVTEAASEVINADRFEVTLLRDGAPQTVTLEFDAPLPPPTTEELPPPVTVRELLNDPERLSGLGRALLDRGPDGNYTGYRLSGFRRNSPLDLLGFKNADVVHEVAGVSVTDMREAQDALAAAQAADTFDVILTRRGQRLTLTLEADTQLPLDRVRP